jgi:DNA-binding transcriptional regulator YdaS (Cro superfamily)
MELKTYIHGEQGRASRLAEALGISRSYLSQMVNGVAPISPERCVDIERATDRSVTRKDLRPHDWQRIWPELMPPSVTHAAGRRKDDAVETTVRQGAGAIGGHVVHATGTPSN